MSKPPSVYPSKVDWWLAALLCTGPLSAIGLGVALCTMYGWFGLYAIFVGLFMAAIITLLTVPCRYTITATALEIRCGMIDEKINLRSIVAVTPTFATTSAPALSLQRVKITLPRGSQLISPVRRDEFIAELLQKCRQATSPEPAADRAFQK